jgi:hypothetical protein
VGLGFVEHFQNLNSKPARVGNHGHIKLEDLYNERIKIFNSFRKQIWRENRVEMRAHIMLDVVPIFVAPVPSLLHQNNIGVTYVRISNFRMEPVRSVPLYSMAMP